MKTATSLSLALPVLLLAAGTAFAEIKTVINHNDNEHASAEFKFADVPPPAKSDAGAQAKVSIIAGSRDQNGGEISRLTDGRVPTEADEPEANFFFAQGVDGGRLRFDFGQVIEVKQVNTYSWHPDTRAPQVYELYASDGTADGFKAEPDADTDPAKAGWKLVTKVAARSGGGQYGVSISDTAGLIGKYRYLLFVCAATETADPFGNTFYSEIDVIAGDSTNTTDTASAVAYVPFVTNSVDGKCKITIDFSKAPELKEWAEQKLAPVLAEWYPKLTDMLASDGYTAPTEFSVRLAPGNGVAATGGTRVTANSDWLKRELKREAIGALLHEEVHVIQQYGRARRNNPNATRAPGWLTEAIPDYIRWFLYEPDSHGADLVWIKRQRNFVPKYDTAYRPGANFLNWASEKYDKKLVSKLNAAIRSGKYSEEIWKESTGKTADELGADWKAEILKEIAPSPVQ